jgi:uncharacterized oligopeptide transporter (OPT) family protein
MEQNPTDPGARPDDLTQNPFYMTEEEPGAAAKEEVKPFISPSMFLPEITLKAVILGVLLSVILASANTYLGLFAGMTVSASIPAAVISMAILRLFKNSNILENNIVQTAASAGESLAAGVIFTFPALILLKTWSGFDYLQTTTIAALGGLLGVLFSVPLRRALVVDSPLKFPEGVATAEVLEVGEEGGSGVLYILCAGLVGGLFKLGASGLTLWKEIFETATYAGKSSIAYFGTNMSPALVGVGYIVGINIAVLVFIGGAINWFIAIPYVASQDEAPPVWVAPEKATPEEERPWNEFVIALTPFVEEIPITEEMTADERAEAEAHNATLDEQNAQIELDNEAALATAGEQVDAAEYANEIWSKRTRYLGVGAMLVGGIWALLRLFPSLIRGVQTSLSAYGRGLDDQNGGPKLLRTERDIPMKYILIMTVIGLIPLFFVYYDITGGDLGISAFMAVIMLIAGFLFSAVAAYMAGLVGSSNNPISGVTIATILVSSLLLVALAGRDHPEIGAAAAIMIGATVCCAAAISGDNMQDLKAGQLVGATPYKQQIMQVVGVLSAALVMAPVLTLLQTGYGIGEAVKPGVQALEAPQASLMASVAEGVFGAGLPWTIVGIGMGIAAVVIILDLILEAMGAKFRMPVLAVAVGIYLPFELSVPILFGGLISVLAKRLTRNMPKNARAKAERQGMLFAAGLITGEALIGILLAIPKALEVDISVLSSPMAWPGMTLLIIVMIALAFSGSKQPADET